MKKNKSVKLRNSIAYQLLKIVFAIYFFISISITVGHMVMEYLSAKEMVVEELNLLQLAFEDGLSTSLFDLNNEQLNSIIDGMYNVPVLVGIKIEAINRNIPVTSIAIGSIINSDGKREMVNPKKKSQPSSASAGKLIAHSFTIYQPESTVKIAQGTLYSSEKIIFSKVKDGFLRILLSAIVKTIALWCLFLWAANGRLSRPLRQMALEVSQLNIEKLEGVKINVCAKTGTELKILEESFNQMIQNSSRLTKSIVESAKKYRMIFENASEGLFQITPSGGIVSANPAIAKMFGYEKPDEMIQRVNNFAEQCYVNPVDHLAFTTIIETNTRATGFERRFKRRDGSTFWGVASGQSVKDDKGTLLYYEGSLVDITEQKEKLKADKARVVAEEASRSKSEFLANMSHEIRTPMNAIIGLAHLAQKTDMTPKQSDYLQKIESSGFSLLGIINDILDFSKIEANKLSMESIDFNLQAVLDNVVNLINIKADEKKLELLFDVGRDVPLGLVGDPLRLGQILINLAGNSIKFTKEGQVLIKVDLIDNAPEQTTVGLRFSIADSGIGLTQEEISRLFQSFSQADGSTTRKYGGTGLGLSISKQLVSMMGGEISVESVHGEGSTFIFTAEFGVQSEKNQLQLLSPGELHGMRVLVVDDNEQSREILRELMEEFHFTVTEAASGEEAISTLKNSADSKPFDLVLMDWQMDGLDGIETAKRIKEDTNLDRMPAILMVTAFGREEIMSQANNVGMDGFLIKPVNRSLLFDTIMNLFGKTGVLDQNLIIRDPGELMKLDTISGACVLLVEDNKINQQVATELLESAGIIVTLACNGIEAVSAVNENNPGFDGVLMDIQMPEMDGYEATRIIRKNPEHVELPIIAMTANAMAGDREKCIDAGMNDHISKPIEPKFLFETLVKWLPETDNEKDNEKGTPFPGRLEKVSNQDLPGHLAGIDLADGLRRTGGRPDFYFQMLTDFAIDHGGDLKLIMASIDERDLDLATRLLHTLKGVAGGIGAVSLYETSQRLESQLRGDKTEDQSSLLAAFEKDFIEVMESLKQNLKKSRKKSEKNTGSVDDSVIDALISDIRTMVEEMDPDAEDKAQDLFEIINQTDSEVSHRIKDLTKNLAKQTSDFDFEAAILTLDKMKTFMLE